MTSIFISYRRADSQAITDRIHEYIARKFGADNVFQDVQQIPAGVDFREEIRQQIALRDVMLVIISSQWAHIAGQDDLTPRILSSDDYVRIEIEAGLSRESMLVVPVLIGDTKMPLASELPESLQPLLFRNAVRVRHNPYFNDTMEHLVNQIDKATRPQNNSSRKGLFGLVAMTSVIVFGLLAFVFANTTDNPINNATDSSSYAAQETVAATSSPDVSTVIEPFQDGETGVLIAQIEHIGGEERDVQRFIVDDLKQHFEINVPFSRIPVRAYPGIITSDEQARLVAEQFAATAIVWGNYDDSRVELAVQLGVLSRFPNLTDRRQKLEEVLNARVRMTNERTETLAFSVVAVINGLATFTDNPFQIARNLAVLQEIDMLTAMPIGNGISANFHRYLLNYIDNPEDAISALSKSINLDSGNALLYVARSFGYQRIGLIDRAREDVLSAKQLGPNGWYGPSMNLMVTTFYYERNADDALVHANDLVNALPEDWFALSMRAVIHYFQGNYEQANIDADEAITLSPETNYPHMIASAVALRDGRLVDSQVLLRTVLEQFPDPLSAYRALSVSYDLDFARKDVAQLVEVFGYLVLRRWSDLINVVDEALSYGTEMSDLDMLQGIAYCNLGDYEAAEAAYTRGIELDPDFIMLYSLRAEVRQKQGNTMGALADVGVMGQSDLAGVFVPLIPFIQSGELSCENMFDVDLESLGT